MQHDNDHLLVETICPAHSAMRLAVVTETYPPEVNGVALTLQRLVNGLSERGHSVQLVRPRQRGVDAGGAQPNPNDEVLMRGISIPRYPNLQLGLPARRKLQALWLRQRPDLVHIATEGPLGWSALQTARKLKIPVTSEFRTNFHAYSSHYGIGWLSKPIMTYLRRFHNQCALTMVPTQALTQRLTEMGFERLHVVGRAVDVQRFQPGRRDAALRSSWGAVDDTPVVLYAGRLAPEKNLAALVRAYATARLSRPDTRLVVVGDGPARSELQAAVPDAIFTGTLDHAVLSRCYASADIFCFPSQSETFGNVVLEAMASGMAVVAFDYAAAAEHIHSGRNGVLAALDQEAAFVQSVVRLVQDRALRCNLGTLARASMQYTTWPAIVRQVEALMRATLEAQQASLPTSRAAAVLTV